MSKQKIYCISGLGLTEKIFFRLKIPGVDLQFIEWIEPHKEESLQAYCRRLLTQIKDENPVLLGVSFGGIAAQEIAKLIPCKQVFIVSSIKQAKERPPYFAPFRVFPFYKALDTQQVLLKSLALWGGLLGLKSEASRSFFSEMIGKCSTNYLNWAITMVLQWENEHIPENLTHIHGSKDQVFPIGRIKNAVIIKGADHGMIATHPRQIAREIEGVLHATV